MKTDVHRGPQKAPIPESPKLPEALCSGASTGEPGAALTEDLALKARIECAQQLRSQGISFVDNPSFHMADAERAILSSPNPKDDKSPELKHPESAQRGLVGMLPPLSAGQEAYLFRKMNFLKFLAQQGIGSLSEKDPDAEALHKIQECLQGAQAILHQVAASNLPLVLKVVNTFDSKKISRDEMFS